MSTFHKKRSKKLNTTTFPLPQTGQTRNASKLIKTSVFISYVPHHMFREDREHQEA